MKYTYCPSCGNILTDKLIGDEGLVRFCNVCDRPYFDNPAICVITTVVNEKNQVLLLKSNYISTTKWTLVAGYVKNGETLEDAAVREIMEETGQRVDRLSYVRSYYFRPGELVMCGFIAWVKQCDSAHSNEVNDLFWCDIGEVSRFINRDNNLSGTHFDSCHDLLSGE